MKDSKEYRRATNELVKILKEEGIKLGAVDERLRKLTAEAGQDKIDAANAYIRRYLLEKEANPKEGGIWNYRKELLKISSIKQRLTNIQKRAEKGTIEGPMDNDTITAAALYMRRWYLEHPKKGKGKKQKQIAVWSVPKVLAIDRLGEFAKRNWQNLPDKIYRATRDRKPDVIVKLMRNLPEGEKSLDDALKKLKRDDVERAFDKVYNEYLRDSDAFRAFVKERGYVDVEKALKKLDEKSTQGERRFIASNVQDFLNATAGSSERSWYEKLHKDLGVLYRLLDLKRRDLDANGVVDMRTIAAVSVYLWRKANLLHHPGRWAEPLKDIEPEKIKEPERRRRPLPF